MTWDIEMTHFGQSDDPLQLSDQGSRMSRLLPLAALSVIVAALATAPCTVSAAGSGSPAVAAAACAFKGLEQEHLGPSYLTSLSVSGVSCATGKRLVTAYYKCRLRSGGVKGRCHSRVLGFSCSEHRNGIPVQFFAKVTCVSAHRRVVHTYVQNT
jgi:hypothetical protein